MKRKRDESDDQKATAWTSKIKKLFGVRQNKNYSDNKGDCHVKYIKNSIPSIDGVVVKIRNHGVTGQTTCNIVVMVSKLDKVVDSFLTNPAMQYFIVNDSEGKPMYDRVRVFETHKVKESDLISTGETLPTQIVSFADKSKKSKYISITPSTQSETILHQYHIYDVSKYEGITDISPFKTGCAVTLYNISVTVVSGAKFINCTNIKLKDSHTQTKLTNEDIVSAFNPHLNTVIRPYDPKLQVSYAIKSNCITEKRSMLDPVQYSCTKIQKKDLQPLYVYKAVFECFLNGDGLFGVAIVHIAFLRNACYSTLGISDLDVVQSLLNKNIVEFFCTTFVNRKSSELLDTSIKEKYNKLDIEDLSSNKDAILFNIPLVGVEVIFNMKNFIVTQGWNIPMSLVKTFWEEILGNTEDSAQSNGLFNYFNSNPNTDIINVNELCDQKLSHFTDSGHFEAYVTPISPEQSTQDIKRIFDKNISDRLAKIKKSEDDHNKKNYDVEFKAETISLMNAVKDYSKLKMPGLVTYVWLVKKKSQY